MKFLPSIWSGLFFLGVSACSAEEPLKSETRLLTSFESPAGLHDVTAQSGEFRMVEEGATNGVKAVWLKLSPPDNYPKVTFVQKTPLDLRGYGGIAFDLYNPTTESARFGIRLDSGCSGTKGSMQGGGAIEGKEKATFMIAFGVDPKSMGMASLPGSGAFRSAGGGGAIDLSSIVEWQIFGIRPWTSFELIIDNVRAVPGVKQDFTGILDQYGQYTRADWPGKIKSDADFATQLVAEDADLKAHPAPAGFNKYGGWADGPQLQATGFFRVEKYNGKWAFVDPDGRLFLSFGPTTLGSSSTMPLAGRESMFAAPPSEDPVLHKYISQDGKTMDALRPNLERKYGANFDKIWYARAYDRLRSWGFNSIGAFASWETLANGKVPYTATLWPGGNHARIPTGGSSKVDDPFDPRFAVNVLNAAKGQARRVKDDPFFLGTFVGNEEHWGHFRSGPRSHYSVPLGALGSKADASPAKRAFIAKLQEKYGDIAKLNTAWGTTHADWTALNEPLTFKDSELTPAVLADFSLLLKNFGKEYFRTVQAALKEADPNHLYLGCRFAGYSTELLEGLAAHCDVMSLNVYRLAVDPKEFTILDAYDLPVVIGEFHFGAFDRGMFNGGLVSVADQAARGRVYQSYVRSILDNPKFIGAHWFQFTDQPTIGRGDGENGNVGFVSITDTPYPELIKAAREVHAEIYTYRFGK